MDEVLKSRNGRPFVEPTPELEEIAAIAAALEAMISPSALAGDSAGARSATVNAARWLAQARIDALR
jgi:hypothetical protein